MSKENTGKWRNHNNQVRKMKFPDRSPLKAVPGEPSAHMFGVFGIPVTGETRAKEWKRVRLLALPVPVGVLFSVFTCVAMFSCTVSVYSRGCPQ